MEEEKKLKNYLYLGLLALGIKLDSKSINESLCYIKMLEKTRREVNLTSISDPYEMIDKLILDSLSGMKIINTLIGRPNLKNLNFIDIGSGAGLPGIPIKLAYQKISIVLLEARKNRKNFLENVIRQINLKKIVTLQDRAESIGRMVQHREKYDIVLSRAVAPLNILCEYCLPLCRMNGLMVAYKGSNCFNEWKDAKKVIEKLGGVLRNISQIRIPNSLYDRYIVIIQKKSPIPNEFPRRNGIPQKRPLSF